MIHGRFQPFHNGHLEYLRSAGYEVVVLDEGAEKEVSGSQVRELMRRGGEWEALVPPGVAGVIHSLERVPA